MQTTLRKRSLQVYDLTYGFAFHAPIGFFLLGYVRLKTELKQKVVNVKRAVSEQMATTDSFGFLLYQVVQTGSL